MKSEQGPLGKRDKARLAAALDQLPPEIAYLRDPILNVANQDQDLLGSGDADTTSLVQAVREAGCSSAAPLDAGNAADLLERWLDQLPDKNARWVGPAFFVEGALRGFDLFQFDPHDAEPPRKPALGLRRIEIDVPAGMKTKLYDGGLEMSNRDVQIIVGEIDSATYKIRREGYTRRVELTPDWPWRPNPDLREELESTFEVGKAVGLRMLTRHVKSGLSVMCNYLLSLPEAEVEVGMFARKKTGSDLTRYEGILTTLRAK
jgi:hypothetical protein